MSSCSCRPVEWDQRRGYQLSNGTVELTLLTGGGHIADFRLSGTSTNVIWEAPWHTIEPQSFSDDDISLYGDRAIGRFLSGYTGHALVLGYFGMPSPEEVAQGLPLHGEAASAEQVSHQHFSISVFQRLAASRPRRFRCSFCRSALRSRR